jgi:hypothetical protein
MQKILLLAGLSISTLVSASPKIYMPSNPWLFLSAIGYSKTSNMMSNDAQSASLRLALGHDLSKTLNVNIGAELGVQTGSHMRLKMSTANHINLSSTAVQTTIMPMVDLLLTARKSLIDSKKVSGYIKAGAAYRTMHFDRDTINDLRKINPELQVGISMPITSNACLSFGYQGVFSSDMNLTTTTTGNGNVKNIPSVHGALLSITYKSKE